MDEIHFASPKELPWNDFLEIPAHTHTGISTVVSFRRAFCLGSAHVNAQDYTCSELDDIGKLGLRKKDSTTLFACGPL